MSIKTKYDALRKKYNLPLYDKINLDFSIEDIDSCSDLLLAKIRLKIFEKLESYAKLIEKVIQPNNDLSTFYEAKYLNDKQRNQAYNIFKKLMHMIRNSNLAAVNNNDEDNVTFIKETFTSWNNLKPEIEALMNDLSAVWKKETDIKNDLSYFG